MGLIDEYQERREVERARLKPKPRRRLRSMIEEDTCVVCGSWPIEVHHIVPRSHFTGRRDAPTNNPANLMPLCHEHHQNHHTLGREHRIPRHLLSDEQRHFVLAHKSQAWMDAWYPV